MLWKYQHPRDENSLKELDGRIKYNRAGDDFTSGATLRCVQLAPLGWTKRRGGYRWMISSIVKRGKIPCIFVVCVSELPCDTAPGCLLKVGRHGSVIHWFQLHSTSDNLHAQGNGLLDIKDCSYWEGRVWFVRLEHKAAHDSELTSGWWLSPESLENDTESWPLVRGGVIKGRNRDLKGHVGNGNLGRNCVLDSPNQTEHEFRCLRLTSAENSLQNSQNFWSYSNRSVCRTALIWILPEYSIRS
jgi:hypothetical protein